MNAKRTMTEGELLEELQADINVPWIYRWTRVSHYYGDSVRELLIVCAILMLVTAPFYADDIKLELPFIIIGAVLMVYVAGLTSPLKLGVIRADAVTSGVGLVIYESWALFGYQNDPLHQFVLRQAIAMIFLYALYFSTKTLRNMVLRKTGQPDTPKEFTEDVTGITRTEKERIEWKQQAREALVELNEHEKIDFSD